MTFLTREVVDLIFSYGEQAISDGKEGFRQGMSYSDFIYFMLSEIGKGSSIHAAKYWMKCCDLDRDNINNNSLFSLSRQDLRLFHRMHILRLQQSRQVMIERWKLMSFDDFCCVLYGILSLPLPCNEYNNISIDWEDILNQIIEDDFTHSATLFFDLLLNPSHFLVWWTSDEADMMEMKTKKRNDWRRSDWDRYAEKEHRRLIRMKFA